MTAKKTTKLAQPPTRAESLKRLIRSNWRALALLVVAAMILGAGLADLAK